MSQSLSLLLSRSIRHRRPLPCIQVTNGTMAQAVVEGMKDHPFSLVYHTTDSPGQDQWIIDQIRGIVHRGSGHIGCIIVPTKNGASHYEDMTLVRAHHAKISKGAAEMISSLRMKDLHEVVNTHQMVGVRLEDVIRPPFSELKAATKQVKVPLICSGDAYTPSQWHQLLKTGVAGIWFDSLILQAYTAGVRTALRDREVFQPHQFESVGLKAVKSCVHQIATSIYQ